MVLSRVRRPFVLDPSEAPTRLADPTLGSHLAMWLVVHGLCRHGRSNNIGVPKLGSLFEPSVLLPRHSFSCTASQHVRPPCSRGGGRRRPMVGTHCACCIYVCGRGSDQLMPLKRPTWGAMLATVRPPLLRRGGRRRRPSPGRGGPSLVPEPGEATYHPRCLPTSIASRRSP